VYLLSFRVVTLETELYDVLGVSSTATGGMQLAHNLVRPF
jgi:hypothetical protein